MISYCSLVTIFMFCVMVPIATTWLLCELGSNAELFGEGNGTHSSTFAWKIPWMEEPGGLQSMGLLRVGHD